MVEGTEGLFLGTRQTDIRFAGKEVDEFIDLKAASAISGVSPATLRYQAATGRLRATRLGGRWVTKRQWLNEYQNLRPLILSD
ncbi:MAG: helix-turn-helix domain-containing protein, partial [Dehalococcoidia bacterium]|nr:helix-turn-helix domain-containing protein [Dehalococcoidia bacterium]